MTPTTIGTLVRLLADRTPEPPGMLPLPPPGEWSAERGYNVDGARVAVGLAHSPG